MKERAGVMREGGVKERAGVVREGGVKERAGVMREGKEKTWCVENEREGLRENKSNRE